MGNFEHVNSDTSGHAQEHSESPVLYLITTMADTTWRMFIPTIGLLLVGSYLDDYLHISPWLMLSGFVGGALLSTLLIKRQLSKGRRV